MLGSFIQLLKERLGDDESMLSMCLCMDDKGFFFLIGVLNLVYTHNKIFQLETENFHN